MANGRDRSLSSRLRDRALEAEKNHEKFTAGVESRVEDFVLKSVCEPILPWIPSAVTPNLISLVNLIICCLSFPISLLVAHLDERADAGEVSRLLPLLSRLFLSSIVFVSMLLDCLDGMHARRTKQCSKLGEVIDHSLDAINIPLMTTTVLVGLHFPTIVVVLGAIGAGCVYNAQLIVYRRTRVMIQPPTNGVEAQLMVCVVHVAYGLVAYALHQDSVYMYWLTTAVSTCSNIAQVINVGYFLRYLGRADMLHHLEFIVHMSLPALLHLYGYLGTGGYLLAYVLICFRINGVYCIRAILHVPPKPFRLSGFLFSDVSAWFVVYSVAAVFFPSPWLLSVCLALFALYVSGSNWYDLQQCFPAQAQRSAPPSSA